MDKKQKEKVQWEWSMVKRLLHYLAPYRFWIAFSIVLLCVGKVIEAVIPAFIGKVVELVLEQQNVSELWAQIVSWSGIVIFLLFVAAIFDACNVFLKNWIGQQGVFQLRMEVYTHIQNMPIEFFNRSAVGTLMTRTIHDVEQISQMFTESIVPLFGSALLFMSIIVAMFFVDWHAAIVLVAIFPCVALLTNSFRLNQKSAFRWVRTVVAKMNAFVQEHLMGAPTIRSFGLQEQEMELFAEINQEHRNANVKTIHYFAFFFSGIDFAQSFSLIAIFAILVLFASRETPFDAGAFFTFSLYIMMLYRPLADLAERYNLLQSAVAAAEKIFALLDQKTEKQEREKYVLDRIETIVFEDVWFAYKEAHWILKGFHLAIQEGESIALVGVTGAGKTTLMNLLMRFYDVQKGIILINGRDIREYSLNQLRRQFSVVLQDPEIFSGTFYENIAFGDTAISRKDAWEAIDHVHLKPLLETYSEGLDRTLLERGKSLSAGQRQLLAFARAVAHQRNVLILDEATANIDTVTEKMIQKVLKEILHERTSLVIAHRLSTIKDVNTIVVVHEGVALEVGSHEELLKKKGIYEKLYRLQFLENGS